MWQKVLLECFRCTTQTHLTILDRRRDSSSNVIQSFLRGVKRRGKKGGEKDEE